MSFFVVFKEAFLFQRWFSALDAMLAETRGKGRGFELAARSEMSAGRSFLTRVARLSKAAEQDTFLCHFFFL